MLGEYLFCDEENKENVFLDDTLSSKSNGKQRRKPLTIAIEGNIGCGKSTFLQHLNKDPLVEVIPEPVDLWKNIRGQNILDLMYKDPERWSYAFQSYVQLTMLNVHCKELKQKKRVKVMERSIYSARFCFLENLYQSDLINSVDSAILDEWFKWMTDSVDLELDLIVYLKSSPQTCYKRIQGRQRTEEESIPMSYLETLHELHEDWLMKETRFKLPAPLLILDGEQDVETIVQAFHSQKIRLFGQLWT